MSQERFLSQTIGQETLVYDQEIQAYHSLSEVAVAIQALHNDGAGLIEIQQEIAQRFPSHADHCEELVAKTLAELRDRGLLNDSEAVLEATEFKMGRRRVLQIAGVTVLATVAASVPAAAASGSLKVFDALYFHSADSPGPPPSGTATDCGGTTTATTVTTDVSARVQSSVTDDPGDHSLTFTVSTAFFGTDPCNNGANPGCKNQLRIHYACNGSAPTYAFICDGVAVNIHCP